MQCKDFEVVMEQEGLAPLPEAARAHVASCRHCQALVGDLATIVALANDLPAEVDPPARIWTSLRVQLELEGIIREPAAVPTAGRQSRWHGFSNLFRARALAIATVGLLIVIAAILQIRTDHVATVPPSSLTPGVNFGEARTALSDQEPLARGMILASDSPVDASLRDNLEKVDDFIADCERRVKEEPQDELAREYLASAYRQKAELLSAMLDRGRSVN